MRAFTYCRWLAVLCVVLLSVRIAWIGDDALITLRTALNAAHGWGLGFNAGENVDAYTHPLWFLIWLAFGRLTNEWVFSILGLSFLFTGIAVALVVWCTKSMVQLVVVTGLLAFSNAFMEYSTSGLENPLAYAGIGALIALSLASRETRNRLGIWWPILIGLTAAAVVLTRMDLLLLIVIPLIMLAWHYRRDAHVLIAAAVAFIAPLLIWFMWSKFEYGAWLPNTYEAKRNLHIPASELVFQGFRYLWVTFEHDPISMLALVLGLGASLLLGSSMNRAWGIGALVYLAYVVWIGGDYMAGRFIAIPVYVACFCLALVPSSRFGISGVGSGVAQTAASLAALALILLASVQMAGGPSVLTNPQDARWDFQKAGGIADERGLSTVRGRGLDSFIYGGGLSVPTFVASNDPTVLTLPLMNIHALSRGWPDRASDVETPEGVMETCGLLPVYGLTTGPRTTIVDSCGLTDRFIASLPFVPPTAMAWRAGHFERQLPDGYMDAVIQGNPDLVKDRALAQRLRTIWAEIRTE